MFSRTHQIIISILPDRSRVAVEEESFDEFGKEIDVHMAADLCTKKEKEMTQPFFYIALDAYIVRRAKTSLRFVGTI